MIAGDYKYTKLGLIPIEWTIKKGEDITERITKGSSPNWQGFNYQDEGVLFVTSENVRDGYLDINKPKYLPIAFSEKQKNSKLKKGDLLINIVGASIGRSCEYIADADANINQAVCLFRVKFEADKQFVKYYLQQDAVIRRLIGTQTESARPNLSLADMRGFEFILPEKNEEKLRIASILSTWDKAIELKEKLIEQKKEQKKGLMQKLLTGQIRWNDTEKYSEAEIKKRLEMISGGEVPEGYKDTVVGILPEDWIVTKLKRISKRIQRKNEGKEDKPVLTISSLSGFLNQSDRFSKVIAGENLSKYILIKQDEFAYNKGNSKTYPCGCIFRLEDCEEALVPNVYYCFQIVEGDTEFYKHYFASGKLNKQLGKVINTGVRNDGLLNLDVVDFFNIPVACPPKKEQLKIAEILTSAGQEIDCLEREFAFIKEQKKGLMQRLLTGKVRVKV